MTDRSTVKFGLILTHVFARAVDCATEEGLIRTGQGCFVCPQTDLRFRIVTDEHHLATYPQGTRVLIAPGAHQHPKYDQLVAICRERGYRRRKDALVVYDASTGTSTDQPSALGAPPGT